VVAAANNKKKEPPPILVLCWQCKGWDTLPKAGGMNDQDYRTMYLMNLLSRVYDAALAWKKSPKDMTSDQQRVFAWLLEQGIK